MLTRSKIFVSLTLIYISSRLCGFADFYVDSNGRFRFSDKLFKFSSAYHTLMVALLFYILTVTRDQIVGSTATTLVMFNACGVTLLFIINKFSQKFYEKKSIAPLWKNLGTLEKNMELLKIHVKPKMITIQSVISFLPTQIFLTCLVAGQYYISLRLSSSKTTALVFAGILYLMETERTVVTGQFCSLLFAISNMFAAIAGSINDLKLRELRILARFYHELWKAVRTTNRVYSIHLLISFGVDFLCFVTYTQLITYDFLEGKVTSICVLSMAWMLVLSSRIFAIIAASHSCESSTCNIKSALGKAWIHSEMSRVKQELNMFILQVNHEQVKITVGGLFAIKLSLLLSIIGAVATYMIIVIQLDSHFTVLMLRFN